MVHARIHTTSVTSTTRGIAWIFSQRCRANTSDDRRQSIIAEQQKMQGDLVPLFLDINCKRFIDILLQLIESSPPSSFLCCCDCCFSHIFIFLSTSFEARFPCLNYSVFIDYLRAFSLHLKMMIWSALSSALSMDWPGLLLQSVTK